MVNEQLRYTVSITDLVFVGDWVPQGAFRWHGDAVKFAKRLSKRDRHKRFVRIDRDVAYEPNYFREGQPADHLDDCPEL